MGNYFTAADVALYGALHPIVVCCITLRIDCLCLTQCAQSQLQPPQYYATPAITRYFDHIQSKPGVLRAAQALSPAFSFVTFDLESAPKIERKADPPKRKEKAPKPPASQQPEEPKKAAKPEEADANKKEEKPQKDKKERKEKNKETPAAAEGGKKKGGGAGASKPAEEDGEPVPSMIDMRVGHIIDGATSFASRILASNPRRPLVKKHPDADSLYVEVRFIQIFLRVNSMLMVPDSK